MSKSLNKVQIIGNLGADPDVRHTQAGNVVANLNIATTDSYKDKNGDFQESTEWHKVVFWSNVAEICEKYLRKGSRVYVEGSLQTRKWQDKDGNDRYTTEIKGFQLLMLDGRRDDSQEQQQDQNNNGGGGDFSQPPELSDSDITF